MNPLALTLRWLRDQHSYSRRFVSQQLNLSKVSVLQHERGSQPKLDVIQRYNDLYEIDVNVVAWCGFGQPNTNSAIENLRCELWKLIQEKVKS